MLLPNYVGVHDPRGRVERVHRWVDAELRDGSREDGGGVHVGEGGCRGRVCQVIGRNKDGLHGKRKTLLTL